MSQEKVFFSPFPFLLLISHSAIHQHWHFRGKKAIRIPNFLFIDLSSNSLNSSGDPTTGMCMYACGQDHVAFCVSYCKACPSKTIYSVSLTCVVHTSSMKLWASEQLAPQKLFLVHLQLGWQTLENSFCVMLKGNKCHPHFSACISYISVWRREERECSKE